MNWTDPNGQLTGRETMHGKPAILPDTRLVYHESGRWKPLAEYHDGKGCEDGHDTGSGRDLELDPRERDAGERSEDDRAPKQPENESEGRGRADVDASVTRSNRIE